MRKLLLAMFVALLMAGCDYWPEDATLNRGHWKRKAERSKQAVLTKLKRARESNSTELNFSSSGSIADLTTLKGLTRLKVLNISVRVSRKKRTDSPTSRRCLSWRRLVTDILANRL